MAFLFAFTSLGFAQDGTWPDLSQPARAVGGGERDAAVVVGVEGYAFVTPVPGAESNAKLWHQYLTETRGIAPLAGNVWEMTQDSYFDSYEGAPTDGSARENPGNPNRLNRGGSMNRDADEARVAYRRIHPDFVPLGSVGFRPVR